MGKEHVPMLINKAVLVFDNMFIFISRKQL